MKKNVMLVFILGLSFLQNTYAEIGTRENSNYNEMAKVVLRSNVTLKGSDGTLRLYSNGSFSFMDRNDERISGTYTLSDGGNTLMLYVTYFMFLQNVCWEISMGKKGCSLLSVIKDRLIIEWKIRYL